MTAEVATMQMGGKTVKGERINFPVTVPGLIYGLIVTPELATWFLEYAKEQFHNRQQSEDRVTSYAEDMGSGRWRHNGETIKFDQRGVMVDGFTRCVAAYLHSVSFITDVRTGVAPESIATIDTGRPRTLANALTMREEVSSTAMAHGLSWVWRYELQELVDKRGARQSHGEALAFLERHPGIRDSVAKTTRIRNKKLAAPGILVAAHYICSRHDPELANEFYDGLESGIDLAMYSPVRMLREALLRRKEKRLKNDEVMKMITFTFNKWANGETMRVMRIPEDVPKVKGFAFSGARTAKPAASKAVAKKKQA